MSMTRTLVVTGTLLVGSAIAGGCGGADDGTPGTATGTPAGQGGGVTTTTGTGGAAGGGGSVPDPTPVEPCEQDNCWLNAPRLSGLCGTRTIDENFQTGLYNVHRYPLDAPAGVDVELTLDVTGGSWEPALVVHAEDGTTLYDGELPLSGGAVTIEGLSSGRGGDSASLRLTAPDDTPLFVFVTSWEAIDGDFGPTIPTDATYALSAFADCPLPDGTCPIAPSDISWFGSGYFTIEDSDDPNDPNYSPYKRDERDAHSGYDLHAPLGVPVVATQAGTIISVTPTDTGLCGISINLAADSGVTFRYCHLQSVMVSQNDVVGVGDQIGTNGETGNANLPHVHFVYLDAPDVTGAGTDEQKSVKVNEYVDGLCL
ncbi:MAG: M23 family metallopeptidase [Deltaproteobacteria bacterium]|nr:M23 family metallopeptidase [Deltaproteobacteria bacterium]MBW2536346.1 M23 family metallopeptidase [Deltaproteobacteria bacterium]